MYIGIMPEAISQYNIKTAFILLVVGALLYYYWKNKSNDKDTDDDNDKKNVSNDDKTSITDIVDDINRKQL